MIAVAVAPRRIATATTGAASLATGQLARMNTTAPSSHSVMLMIER